MGFTAINTSTAGRTAAPITSTGPESTATARDTTIASEYLGRGEVEPAAAPVAAISKKVATKGKKRAATTKESTKRKRRKSSNVDDGMKVTEARPPNELKESTQASATAAQHTSAEARPKKKPPIVDKETQDDSQDVGDDRAECMLSKAKPVSVYAQPTSMDAFDSTSARTSIDSVKANAGQSTIVYQDPSSSISHGATMEFTQPWLNSAADVQAKPGKKKVGAKKKHDKSQTPTVDATVGVSGGEVRRSGRMKPAVNYAGQDGFIVIDDSESSNDTSNRRCSNTARRRTRSSETIGANDGFGEIDDDDTLESAMAIDDAIVNRPATPPPRSRKQNLRDVDEHEDYGGALLTNDELRLLAQIKAKESTKDPIDKPIVRKPFSPAIQDRSPIFGASNTSLLRTCFRVGEALNTGSQAVRSNKNAIIELYARVTSSWRDPPPGRKQHFTFKDLYHDKPPYLEGTFELWNQAQLWDLDSRPFLKATEKGMMCRAIARMRREGQKWKLEVLSVYEVSWEDVNHVAGICNGDVQEDSDEDG